MRSPAPDNFEHQFVAEFLRMEAPRLAAEAARELTERFPAVAARYRPQPTLKWRPALEARIAELAAAIAADRPELLCGQIRLAKTGFAARGVPLEDLHASLIVLTETVVENLPPEGRPLVRMFLKQAEREAAAPCSDEPTNLNTSAPHGPLAAQYLLALLSGDRRTACRLVRDAARRGAAITDIYTHVFIVALRELGRMWLADEISVSEEHFATAATVMAMDQLMADAPCKPPTGRTVVAGCVEGNLHEVGIRMVADFLEMEGWRVIYLGASVPAPDLLLAVQDFSADLLALSASLPTQLQVMTDTVRDVREYRDSAAARRTAPPLRILVGGGAVQACSDLWRDMGADGFACDPAQAAAAADQLCTH